MKHSPRDELNLGSDFAILPATDKSTEDTIIEHNTIITANIYDTNLTTETGVNTTSTNKGNKVR